MVYFRNVQGQGTLRIICGIAFVALAAGVAFYIYPTTPDVISGIQPQQYQQFNPFYVVALTPVSLALFGWLARKKKEPSAPPQDRLRHDHGRSGLWVMLIGSMSIVGTQASVSPNWLISTYLLLTFAELLLSPMGISFVSKVAPPEAQRLDDGRMVCRHSRRQLPCVDPYAPLG